MNYGVTNLVATLGAITVIGACGDSPPGMNEQTGELTIVASMVPMGGSMNVDVNTRIEFRFSNPMQPGMEQYVDLHEGDVAGPIVAGIWEWSGGHTRLEFHPDAPLLHQSRYTMHMGGAVLDAEGRLIDYEHCIAMHNAEWAHENMMGAHQQDSGWQHGNGSYGVITSFETN